MQDWQFEIIKRKIDHTVSISKSVETNIGRKQETQGISKAHDLEIINNAICKGECDYLLEKGHKASVGERRKWGNNEYEKTPSGWKLVSKQGKEYKESEEKIKEGSKDKIKELIIKRLIDSGNNKENSEKMVSKHLDYVLRVYPNTSPKKMAEIIRTIY